MSAELGTYWEQRAIRFGRVDRGLPAVCSYGMPRLYNEAIHACQKLALAPLLAEWRNLDVLEAGCGVGRWSLALAARGNRVTGFDVSATMVALARQNAQHAGLACEFAVANVASFALDRRFDAVLAVTVLQHVIDAAELRLAIHNLARHLKPSGTLALLEVAPTRLTSACDSAIFRARDLATYCALLAEAGLETVEVRGVDATLMRKLSLAAMRKLPTRLARALVAFAAPLCLPLEIAVGRFLPDACWHKVIIARRTE